MEISDPLVLACTLNIGCCHDACFTYLIYFMIVCKSDCSLMLGVEDEDYKSYLTECHHTYTS